MLLVLAHAILSAITLLAIPVVARKALPSDGSKPARHRVDFRPAPGCLFTFNPIRPQGR